MTLTPPQLVEIGGRAAHAASSGAATFPVPELAPVAEAVAADPRTAPPTRAAAARWAANGAPYHDLVRMAADYVLGLEAGQPRRERVYVPKAAAELEPLLALWPGVLALPTTRAFSARDLISWRALPVHPLGIVADECWADGGMCSPAEFFFHDVDHARFKVREDLLALGVAIPDAYRDGTTFDPASGRHRAILPAAVGKVGDRLWKAGEGRSALAGRLFAAMDALADRALAETALLLLFEVVHEKSFPLDERVLRRALSTLVHTARLRHKLEGDFFGPHEPPPCAAERLEDARSWLLERLR